MSATITGTCTDCTDWKYAGSQPGYDHIHAVRVLPDEDHENTHLVLHGFATGFASDRVPGLAQTWVFFEHLEPALVFGRAGRMSSYDITGYGVYQAAREVRFDHDTGRQVTTLYVTGRALDREPGEDKPFARWTRGVNPDSAYYEDPVRRC
ncbi:hypothetical protein [Streptomyces sp. OspMP-M43]|uniref:hypothetical protein n=1 Tax=Streptomyces sp. OspMP-M43 TaxID=1839781 RepID=UPI00081AFAF5|nr:hypothetical protein [Streptomyces sp. OspMP-M43]SCE62653.1 hypothetical protein GA0115261_114163 [Streptomyces sp. OspMP-M43]